MSKSKNKPQRNTRRERTASSFTSPKPLTPRNQVQAEYIRAVEHSPYIIATGHPGTGKTYIPTRIAAKWLRSGEIDKIVMVRPAASASNSLGFFKGTKEDKMAQWLQPILSTLKEEFPRGELDYMMKDEIGKIECVPLETAKGHSWANAFIIVDEAEDCTLKELKTLMTRLGTNSTMCICGDINQVDIERSGVGELLDLVANSNRLANSIEHIDFCDYEDITRSNAVKQLIMGWDEAEGVEIYEFLEKL